MTELVGVVWQALRACRIAGPQPEPEVSDDDAALQRLEEKEPICQADSLLDDAPDALLQDYDSDDHLVIDLPEAALATWRRFSELFVRDLLPMGF